MVRRVLRPSDIGRHYLELQRGILESVEWNSGNSGMECWNDLNLIHNFHVKMKYCNVIFVNES